MVTLARKPVEGSIAENAVEYGTGALAIDACKIGTTEGRWPSNLILQHQTNCCQTDETVGVWECAEGCPAGYLDRQTPKTGAHGRSDRVYEYTPQHVYGDFGLKQRAWAASTGTAVRFFKQVQS